MRRAIAAALLYLLACSPSDRPVASPLLRLTPELRIGGAEQGPASFADVRALAVDRAGQTYVLDAQAQQVRIFDSAGAFVRAIGRPGAGPGEFRMANGMALTPTDHLWVYDPGNSRAQEFDPAGQLERTLRLTLLGYGFVWRGGLDSAGHLYDTSWIPAADSTIAVILRLDPTTSHVDTLPWPHCAGPLPTSYRFPRGTMPVPYSGSEFQLLDPRGFAWCADTRFAKVLQYHLGDTTPFRTFAAAIQPAPVTPAERDSAVARVRAFMKRAGVGSPDYSLIPRIKPIVLRADVDDHARVWLQVQGQDGLQALVFDSAGTLTSHASLPFRPSPWLPTIVHGTHLYAVTKDSLDNPSITRYRIE